MLTTTARWRVLVLAGAFVMGCAFVALFVSPSSLQTSLSGTGQRGGEADVISMQALSGSQLNDGWKEHPDLQMLRSYGVVENIPDEDTLKTYNLKQLSAIYHSYLDNNDIRCHRKLRMGQVGDCGWEVCDDFEWRPIRPCIIYSFGINYEFSFDDDAAKIYGCVVYSFDPSMSRQPTYRRSDRVMFYRLGIGGTTQTKRNGWTLHSLSSFRHMLNHTDKVIDVLKMDVEEAEWSSLINMIQERQLDNVRQLLVEYHMTGDNEKTLRHRLSVIRDVERAGFKKFYVTKNAACARPAIGIPIKRTSCYEVHYVNSKFMRTPVRKKKHVIIMSGAREG
ncbi:probable methyltransferase-like protein 24 [Littorina saxatilis]|uniref:probable methyltransferase-like protein 24 n=1 Tax=Littorina saxatilis TaxID=31220 RepID=UPI0038B5191B